MKLKTLLKKSINLAILDFLSSGFSDSSAGSHVGKSAQTILAIHKNEKHFKHVITNI